MLGESVGRVLVVAPHPDDEMLGAGGTLVRLSRAGARIDFVYVTDGEFEDSPDAMRIATSAIWSVGDHPVGSVHRLTWPDQTLDSVGGAKLAEQVGMYVAELEPDLVLTTWCGDPNLDHRAVFNAVLVATRPPTGVSQVLAFETLSSTEWSHPDVFRPDTYVHLSNEDMRMKQAAVAAYHAAFRPEPHPRNPYGVRARARARGLECHAPYAEAFMTVRRIL